MADFDFTYGYGTTGFAVKQLLGITFLNEKGESVSLSVGDKIEYPEFGGPAMSSSRKIVPTAGRILEITWEESKRMQFTIEQIDTGENVIVFTHSIIRKL